MIRELVKMVLCCLYLGNNVLQTLLIAVSVAPVALSKKWRCLCDFYTNAFRAAFTIVLASKYMRPLEAGAKYAAKDDFGYMRKALRRAPRKNEAANAFADELAASLRYQRDQMLARR